VTDTQTRSPRTGRDPREEANRSVDDARGRRTDEIDTGPKRNGQTPQRYRAGMQKPFAKRHEDPELDFDLGL
jgi:hypothetical protein